MNRNTPNINLEPSDYQILEALVSAKTGLKIDKLRSEALVQTVGEMLKSSGLESVPHLCQALMECQTVDPLWRQLIDRITIGETYFFRDAAQCNALKNNVLPELIAKKRESFRHLSLWSAGCATGEEPYTLAIMLRELIPDINDWTFTILATDINLSSIDYARRGIYKTRSFRMETRPDVQARWFKTRGQNYELDPAVRDMVEFAPLNLVTGDYPSFESRTMNLDLIICRNVTIYFEQKTTHRIIERFQGALNDGGWLVVGHAEPMASVYEGFTPRNFPNAVLYQKSTQRLTAAPLPFAQRAPLPEEFPAELAAPMASRKPTRSNIDALKEARAAAGREDWNALQQWLVSAEHDNPMNPEVHYLRGLMLMNTARFDGAIQALRRAIYCDPSFALAHYALGDLYEKNSNHAEARRCWLRSQQTVAARQPQEELAPGENLTVEMLRDLLNYRLNNLPGGG